jgi:hypothetical protein
MKKHKAKSKKKHRAQSNSQLSAPGSTLSALSSTLFDRREKKRG